MCVCCDLSLLDLMMAFLASTLHQQMQRRWCVQLLLPFLYIIYFLLPLQKSQKRAVEVTTPTNPANKMRNTRNGPSSVSHSNGATPTNGHTRSAMPTTPYSHMTENRYVQNSSTVNLSFLLRRLIYVHYRITLAFIFNIKSS